MSDKLSFMEFERCVERGKAIDGEQLFNLVYALHEENEQLKQDKKRLIGYLHRYGKVDVEDIDEVVLNQEYLDEWGELYGGDVE